MNCQKWFVQKCRIPQGMASLMGQWCPGLLYGCFVPIFPDNFIVYVCLVWFYFQHAYIYIYIIIHIYKYINVFMYIYTYIHTDCKNKYWHIVWMCIYYPSFSDYGWIHTPWYAHCVIVEPTFWVCLTGYSQYIPIVFLWINILQIHTYFYSHPNIHTLIPIGTVKSTFWHEEICYT